MHIAGVVVGLLAVATFGALVARLALPGPGGELAGVRFLLLLFGLAVALFGGIFAAVVARLTYDDWTSYRRRLDDWHYAALNAYEASDGQHKEETITAWEMSASSPLHVLAVALAVHKRVAAGEALPWSVRSMEGQVFLPGPAGNLVRLGDLAPSQAEQMARALHQLGLIRGREARKAGEWSASSADEVVALVAANWHKLRS